MAAKILVFAGSTRTDSVNKKLAKHAASIAKQQGADVCYIDLRDYDMPLYDGDLEEQSGLPENAKSFREILKAHDGFIISSPEYNSSISGVLKNAIDWASRPVTDEPSLVCFKGKVISLLSASPGGLGGLRGLVTVRSIMGNIGSIVLPDQLAISSAFEAFDDSDQLIDQKKTEMLSNIVDGHIKVVQKLFS